MDELGFTRAEVFGQLAKMTIVVVFGWVTLKYTLEALDPTRKQKKEAQDKVSKVDSKAHAFNRLNTLLFYDSISRLTDYLIVWVYLVNPSS